MNKFKFISLALFATALFSSCAGVKDIPYFQDSKNGSKYELPTPKVVKVDISDQLSIVVNSKDPELAAVFNLPIISHTMSGAGSSSGFSSGDGNRISVYTVDSGGNIDMPVLGIVHVLGMTREQVAYTVKNLIISRQLLKDPVVTVEFANLYVSVLGDVAHPGRHAIDHDKVTIVDILSKASDMNVTGLRKNVKVYREEDGRQGCYQVDFTNMENIISSPVYYMQQNDIIYVQPNSMKARQSTVNGNTVLSVSFWISTASFLISIATLLVTLGIIKK
ncbi:MAG: polysaccharide biosynthesis/export family protein [Bacteroidales bacterium]|nr:polysaccharide biosynthesis/export family protein [Bacteroidales bacterium]